ncbi:TatD family hydrolase [Candidatus Uhrbacteria bacterium]|jgi:TatD DNase family protein|nr:TatD family hydrolase [Candidatus Uhrbacteria bacterium]MBT7717462.1 TatD family hydrolase [Candidatus Uhrbacteria bacterium]
MYPQLIDTHTHVHFAAYKGDMDEVIKRSLDEGIGMITVGTQSSTSKKAIEVAEKYDGVWATVGLHPSHLHKQEFNDDNEFDPGKIKTRTEEFDPEYYRELVSHPKVVAVGEFGLDFYHKPRNVEESKVIEDQTAATNLQIDFATEFNKPIVVHCRDAHDLQYEVLKRAVDEGKLPRRGVVHCFTGSLEDARRYIELGFMISFTGILTFSDEIQRIAKELPMESIMIETDAPYLSPAPNRGKRNEPSFVKHIAHVLADIKGMSYKEVAEQTTKNAIEFFQLDM